MICKELDAENAEKKRKEKKLKVLDEVFLKGKTNMQETKARRDTRELHLEMVGDKVTYVRVY